MARTTAALTVAGALVREAVTGVDGNGTTTAASPNLEIQCLVKASDLIAALTAAELAKLRQVRNGQLGIVFAIGLTNDDGTIMTNGYPGKNATFRESQLARAFPLTDDQQRALSNRLQGRPDDATV